MDSLSFQQVTIVLFGSSFAVLFLRGKIIGVICAVSWVASEKLDLFEQFYSTTRKTSWLDEVVFAGST